MMKKASNEKPVKAEKESVKEKTGEKAEEEHRPEDIKKNNFYILVGIGLVVAVIAVLLGIGAFRGSQKDELFQTVEYNNFVFTKIDDMWYTQWQKGIELYTVPLRFNPYETENISITGFVNGSFNKEEVYVTFDPDVEKLAYVALGAAELSINLAQSLDFVRRNFDVIFISP